MNWSNLSFSLKILICLLLIVFLLSGFSLILCYLMVDISYLGTELVEHNIPELLLLSFWQKELLVTRTALERFLEDQTFNRIEIAADDNLKWNLVSQLEPVPETLEDLKRDVEWVIFTYNNKIRGLLRYQNFATAEAIIREEILPDLTTLEKRVGGTYQETYLSLTNKANAISENIVRSLWLLFIISTIAILLSILFAYKLSFSLTRPIEELIAKVKRISSGEYGLQIPGLAQYELQRLVDSINQMSSSLQSSFATLSTEKLFREQIVASLPIGIITVRHEEEKIEVNKEALRLLGKTSEELQPYLDKQTPCHNNQELWNWFYSNEFFQTRKTVITNAEDTFQVIVSQAPLLEEGEQMIGRIFYFMDVSELDRLEKQIYSSEKLALVGELAAGSAHEIRNPLTIIQGFLQLMNASLKERELKKYRIPLLLEEIERINQIIEDMLMLAKPGAPKITYVDLQELIQGLLPLFVPSLPSKVSLSAEVHPVQVNVDAAQIKQVFHNLFRNSLQAIGEKGEISIYTELADKQIYIYIDDNGPGIPAEIKANLFEPFVSTKEKGTGLGLTIIQRIIEGHHGEIELIEKEQRGTKFRISLPLPNEKAT